jgi:hypothetical protein
MKRLFVILPLAVLSACANPPPTPQNKISAQDTRNSASLSNAPSQPPPVAAEPAQPKPPRPPKDEVSVKESQFEPFVVFDGPYNAHNCERRAKDGPCGNLPSRNTITFSFGIRSVVSKDTANASHRIIFDDAYTLITWKGWNAAYDTNATVLDVIDVNHRVINCVRPPVCLFSETVGIDIDDAKLRSLRNSGYTIKFTSKAGDEEIMFLSPEYISAHLDAIDSRFPPKPADAKKPAMNKAKRSADK